VFEFHGSFWAWLGGLGVLTNLPQFCWRYLLPIIVFVNDGVVRGFIFLVQSAGGDDAPEPAIIKLLPDERPHNCLHLSSPLWAQPFVFGGCPRLPGPRRQGP
jgi:hypothetical protein